MKAEMEFNKYLRLALVVSSVVSFCCVQITLAEGGGRTVEDLAKVSPNYIASMISVPFQNITLFKVGPEEKH